MKALTIWILPIKVSSLHSQMFNLLLLELTNWLQFSFCLNYLLQVKCTPKVFKYFLTFIPLKKVWLGKEEIALPNNIISDLSWL